MVVPTDKTNSFRTVGGRPPNQKWKRSVDAKIAEVKEQVLQLPHHKIEPWVTSEKEESFAKQTNQSLATPSPKLLIKDHNNHDHGWDFPTRLTVPETNFTSASLPKNWLLGAHVKNNNPSFQPQRKPWEQRNHLQQLHNSIRRCWRFLPINKTETGEQSSLSLLQRTVGRRSNQHQTLPGLNQVWNASNTNRFCGQILWARQWRRPWREMVHHWWTWIGLAGRSSTSPHPGQHQITLQENQMTRPAQRWWNCSVQQQTFLLHDDTLKWRTTSQNSASRPAGGNHLQFTWGMWLDWSRREVPSTQNDPKMSIETWFFFQPGHWTCVGNQRRPTIWSVSQTKPTTEVPHCRWHPCQSMLQSHPFRSVKKTVWHHNNNGNKQEPANRHNLPTTTHRSSHQKVPNIAWTTTTQ